MWAPQVPIQLLSDSQLTDGDKVVVTAILAHARQEDGKLVCWPSNARLAEITGKPTGTIKRILWKLRGLQYVRSATLIEVEELGIPEGARSLVLDLPYLPRSVTDRFTDETGGFIPEADGVSQMKPGTKKKEQNGTKKIKKEYIDEVIEHVNQVTGRTYRTGSSRSKELERVISARMRELLKEHKDVDKALIQLKCVADEKMIQSNERNPGTGRPRFSADWVKPSTLYRASNFFEYLEEARHRARLEGGVVWHSN